MRALLLVALMIPAVADAQPVKGAGATTVAPLMKAWLEAYAPGGIEYAAVGSSAGREALLRGEAHFALSDARISVPDLQAAGLVQFPVCIEGIVPIVNLPALKPGQLKLTGPVLADLFLGKLRTWNDPVIAALNPGLSLPATAVQTVHRSDGSGATFLFTSYLSAVSTEWKQRVGADAAVKWVGGLEAKGTDGVVEQVKATPGAIGYVDFGRAQKQALVYAQLKNRNGEFVTPAGEAFAAAAVTAPWATAPAFAVVIVDQPGAGVWPIAGTVFAVMRREQAIPARGHAVLRFFDYALGAEGAAVARRLGHVPMPSSVTNVVREAWPRLVKTSAGLSVWQPGQR